MELNRDQIVKALECCSSSDGVSACESGCPYWGGAYDTCPCIDDPNFIVKKALSLIKELTEENERLRAENELLLNIKNLNLDKVISDTVRKMQERLKTYYDRNAMYYGYSIAFNIDRVAKEMLEDKDEHKED